MTITIRSAYTALITPFTDGGAKIDFDRLRANIEHQATSGITGVVPCGTTGESPTLSDEEQRAVIETTIDIAGPLNLQIIAGCGSNSTHHAIELHRFAHECSADASLQVNPYYNKPSQEGLYRHFSMIADSCDLPIVLYNIPTRTGVCLSIETIQRLAAHPNIVAIKDATGGLDLAMQTVATTDLAVLSGDDPLTLPLASIGGVGVISVLSNLAPPLVAALCSAFLSEQWTKARLLHYQLFDLARALLTIDTNPVPIKAAMAALGRDTGAVRPPLVEASNSVQHQIAAIVHNAGIGRQTGVQPTVEVTV